MFKTRKTLLCATIAAHLSLPLFAQQVADTVSPEELQNPDRDTVVVSVNGVDIKVGHMIVALQSLPEQYQQLDDDVLFKGLINQLVQQEALSQKFSDALPPHVVYSLENEKRALVSNQVVRNAMDVELDEADIQALYDERYGSVEAEDEFNASHILVETQEEAATIRQQIADGANFAKTAREKSIGPSGPNGGDLGWFSSGAMVPAFEAAVIALEEGEVSEPVETQFGWHVIMLNEVRKADIPTLEEARASIEGELRQNIANEVITKAADDASVVMVPLDQIDPSVIRRSDLLQ